MKKLLSKISRTLRSMASGFTANKKIRFLNLARKTRNLKAAQTTSKRSSLFAYNYWLCSSGLRAFVSLFKRKPVPQDCEPVRSAMEIKKVFNLRMEEKRRAFLQGMVDGLLVGVIMRFLIKLNQ